MKLIPVYLIAVIILSLTVVEPVGSAATIYKGIASWYSGNDPGILDTTANMEIFDDAKLTCAMWGVPFNTILKVTNLENNKYIYVRVNDRGPARRLVEEGRIVDLTREAFSRIARIKKGLIRVSVEII